MKNLLTKLFFGKDDKISGFIALGIVALIALGCSCGDKFDLSNIGNSGSNSNRTVANSSDTPFGDDTDAGGVPSDTIVQSMIKETTSDFASAIETEDFSTLYAKSSSDFQSTYTEDQMKDVFKTFVTNRKRILPSLKKVPETTAEFSPKPSIRTEKGLEILVVNGKFPTKPFAVKFEYEYVKRGGEWKMLKLIINM
ncbi:MAG: hypothetical protein H7070_10225 [Saprospiraceae bacterium]|nr:hypothetical protein [Pyrinomonadaceae bacterium]